MKKATVHHDSFVVRIWREKDDAADWRGWVQHAGTGQETYVRDLDELLAFLEGRAGRLSDPPSNPGAPVLSVAEGPAAHLK